MKKVSCPRCGGSGETEHTHVVYGICFLCKGNGVISEATLVLTEEKKEAKKNKEIEAQKQIEEADNERWQNLHFSAKQNFDKQVEENNFDLFKMKYFGTCVKIFENKKQPFTKELFESIINDFGGKFYISNKECRLALCKYFRLNGVNNSKFEYNNDSYDYNEFIYN